MDERPRWRDVAEATLNGSGARVRMRACARVPRFRVDARFLPRPAKLARLMVWGGGLGDVKLSLMRLVSRGLGGLVRWEFRFLLPAVCFFFFSAFRSFPLLFYSPAMVCVFRVGRRSFGKRYRALVSANLNGDDLVRWDFKGGKWGLSFLVWGF